MQIRYGRRRGAQKNAKSKAGNIRRKAENIARTARHCAKRRAMTPEQQLASLPPTGASKQRAKLLALLERKTNA